MRFAKLAVLSGVFPPFLICFAHPALAQSSFSSSNYVMEYSFLPVLTPTYIYRSARLFSEDNRNFTFRTFGCEFDVRYVFTNSPMDIQALRYINAAASPYTGARLVNGRATDLAAHRPAGFSCDTNVNLMVLWVGQFSFKAEIIPIAAIHVIPGRRYRGPRRVTFRMHSDMLTPGQQRSAWQKAGEFGEAIFKNWIVRRILRRR